jgi:hypothetical protein
MPDKSFPQFFPLCCDANEWCREMVSAVRGFEPTTSYSALTTYDGYLLALKMILYLKT